MKPLPAYNSTHNNSLDMKAQILSSIQEDIAQCCQYDFLMAQKSGEVAHKQCDAQFLLSVYKRGGHIEFGTRGCRGSSDFPT